MWRWRDVLVRPKCESPSPWPDCTSSGVFFIAESGWGWRSRAGTVSSLWLVSRFEPWLALQKICGKHDLSGRQAFSQPKIIAEPGNCELQARLLWGGVICAGSSRKSQMLRCHAVTAVGISFHRVRWNVLAVKLNVFDVSICWQFLDCTCFSF